MTRHDIFNEKANKRSARKNLFEVHVNWQGASLTWSPHAHVQHLDTGLKLIGIALLKVQSYIFSDEASCTKSLIIRLQNEIWMIYGVVKSQLQMLAMASAFLSVASHPLSESVLFGSSCHNMQATTLKFVTFREILAKHVPVWNFSNNNIEKLWSFVSSTGIS